MIPCHSGEESSGGDEGRRDEGSTEERGRGGGLQ